jgi:hypothetical protein
LGTTPPAQLAAFVHNYIPAAVLFQLTVVAAQAKSDVKPTRAADRCLIFCVFISHSIKSYLLPKHHLL